MDYFIIAVKDGKELLGSDNSAFVRNAKNMVKVNNRLRSFNPMIKPDEVRLYSFTQVYRPDFYKLIKTIKK